MVRYAHKWQADATKPKHCKARHARALVMTSSGRSVFLPRFLTPLAPPDHLVPHGLAVTDVRSPLISPAVRWLRWGGVKRTPRPLSREAQTPVMWRGAHLHAGVLAAEPNCCSARVPAWPHAMSQLSARLRTSPQAVLRRVLRFVSLVPPTPEWTTYRRRYDVWLTAEETLKYCMGDHEELAVLLCNFFLHLGVDASVVLGPCARLARRY